MICISEATRLDVLEFCSIPPSKIHVVHLAADPVFKECQHNTTSGDPPNNTPYLFHLGNRSLNKNFPRLLEAFAVWDMRKSVPLVVAGKDWSPKERQLLIDLGIETNVKNVGYVEDVMLAHLYRNAAAFVYPSLYEGFGIPLLEAMTAGCPVVASRIPSTEEIAQDVPIYFDPNDTDELRYALDQVLFEGRESERTLKGKERSLQFSWERTTRETLRVYDSCL